jgi:uncharacterized protein (TIGR02117 family)
MLPGCVVVTSRAVLPLAPATAMLYVIDRGWHTDIGLPVSELHGPLAATIGPRFPGARYLVFGFGERAYLMGEDRSPIQLLLALFPHPGAMMVTALRAPPEAAFGSGDVVALRVPERSVDQVAAFIWSFFRQDARGQPEPIAWGPYPGSLYYASTGTYALAFTCNTWSAEALHLAGLPVTIAGVVFAGQVMAEARRIAAAQARVAAPRYLCLPERPGHHGPGRSTCCSRAIGDEATC